MITELTKNLIESRGYVFVPSHDRQVGHNLVAVPECYVRVSDGHILWDRDDVLAEINDQIELEIERDLE